MTNYQFNNICEELNEKYPNETRTYAKGDCAITIYFGEKKISLWDDGMITFGTYDSNFIGGINIKLFENVSPENQKRLAETFISTYRGKNEKI